MHNFKGKSLNKILILGSAGFLGREIGHQLSEDTRYEVINHRRELFSLDEWSKLLHFLTELSPDIIINCAATINFSQDADLALMYPINTFLPALLVEYTRKQKAYICHISSTSVNGTKEEYISDKSPFKPDIAYGKSKYLAELNLMQSGVDSQIIRFSGIWGIHGPMHLGINNALNEALNGRRLQLRGSGGERNYIHVKCAAKVIVSLIDMRDTGMYVASSRDSVTIEQMINILTKKYNLEPPDMIDSSRIPNAITECSHEIQDIPLSFEKALERYHL